MAHPFHDKLCVFIGKPQRCSREQVRDALTAVGGIVDNRVLYFTDYVVAFAGAEKTKIYQLAIERERDGFLNILAEERFFDVLDGKAVLPSMPKVAEGVVVIPARDPEAAASEYNQMKQKVLTHRRIKNMAKHGVSVDGVRVKADLRKLEALAYAKKNRDEKD